jgi:hypothetical protein
MTIDTRSLTGYFARRALMTIEGYLLPFALNTAKNNLILISE